MIKNLIFDLGNVIIKYRPAELLVREGVTDPEAHALLMKEIFLAQEWIDADAGIISVQEIEERCKKRIPKEYYQVAHKLITDWFHPMEGIPGMADLLKRRKAEGMGIYVLTNAPSNVHDYFGDVPGHEYADGLVVSADIKMTKPNADVFEYVLNKFGLVAGECLFVDDLKVNTDGAEAVGIHGYTFDGDAKKLDEYITELKKK